MEAQKRTDKTALLPLESWPGPDVAPRPFRHQLLSRLGVLTRSVGESLVDVGISKDGATDFDSLVEEAFVKGVVFRIGGHCD